MLNASSKKPAQVSNVTPADESAVNQVPWSPLSGIAYAVVVYFVAQFLASLIFLPYLRLRHWTTEQSNDWLTNSIIAQFWYVVVAEALTLGAIIWFLRWRKSSLRTLGLHRPKFVDVGYALMGLVSYFILYAVLLSIITKLIPSINVNQQQQTGFQDAVGPLKLILTFVSLVILPPFVEEIVFRGLVFTGLKSKLPFIYAALATSLLFASAHLEFGTGKPLLWVAAIDTFTLSLVLCYLRQKTGRLWSGIGIHALKNGIAFLSLFVLHVK